MARLSVGIVGLGSMGLGMAKNALKAGLAVKGYDIFETARLAFRDAGGKTADSAAETARDVDVLLLMVVNAQQAREVLFGAESAAGAAAAGTVVMLCCTIAPRDAREIACQLEALGLLVLDAPVSGGRVGAEAGSLTIMAAGAEAAFRKASPLLDAVAGQLHRVGEEAGLGATYKVVHQLAAGVHLVAAAEVMAFGAKVGCDPDTLFRIVSQSSGRSWMFSDRVPHMLDDDFTPHSMVDIFVKDLGLVLETGQEARTPLPIASAAHQLLLAASAMGHGRIDDAAVVKVYETTTGVRVRRNLRPAAQ